ncbi:MAG: YHS domain-containing (seleno)protein [Desulfobacterales bacterium]|nr:YHS domain-containing (seleno)protein [Desulfobacterales bacterium]
MKIEVRTVTLVVAAAIFISVAAPGLAEAKSEIYKNWRGVAIKGYDPVAFHTEGKPVKGSGDYELKWKDAKWRFASAENRDLFEADPEKYAPRYGGYCAWAVSEGYTASVDPENAWSIVDGRLYLNYNAEIKQKWEKDIPGHIKKADANWPGVLN